ncbi:hypothetical protein DFH11DRAFT_1593409 [Phellopilus nigrolimitatus]|nr:hypothetical protein DFH11DRAFT_1593409 [Phellopilus nigrolimitatus]
MLYWLSRTTLYVIILTATILSKAQLIGLMDCSSSSKERKEKKKDKQENAAHNAPHGRKRTFFLILLNLTLNSTNLLKLSDRKGVVLHQCENAHRPSRIAENGGRRSASS